MRITLSTFMVLACAMILALPATAQQGTSRDTYYVSATTGATSNDGLSPEKPLKNLQAAFDKAPDGANVTIKVAEGNYLGDSDCGYLYFNSSDNPTAAKPAKYFKLYGGYSPDFQTRDLNTYITKIQPGVAQTSLKTALLNVNSKHYNGQKNVDDEIVIDGITFDMGEYNLYYAANTGDDQSGTPNSGVLTGRMLLTGESAKSTVGKGTYTAYALRLNAEGKVKIQNCVFVNCRNYAIQGTIHNGQVDISNNIFVAVRMAACDVRGTTNNFNSTSLDFHHNTVLFTWATNRFNESMGQGFRFTNGIKTINVHHNIFGGCQRTAVERAFYESTAALEASKQYYLENNLFYENANDLELTNGASVPIFVAADAIADVADKELTPGRRVNNQAMDANAYESFIMTIDQCYLKGFLRQKEEKTPCMYANKYPWEKAKNLFGKGGDYGAQLPTDFVANADAGYEESCTEADPNPGPDPNNQTPVVSTAVNFRIAVDGRTITIFEAEGHTLELYNVAGVRMHRVDAVSGSRYQVTVPQDGLYIVRVGNTSRKVVIQ